MWVGMDRERSLDRGGSMANPSCRMEGRFGAGSRGIPGPAGSDLLSRGISGRESLTTNVSRSSPRVNNSHSGLSRPLFGDSVCHVSFVTFQKPAPILKGARGTPSSCLGLTGTVGAKTLDKKSASRFVTPGMCSRKVSLYTSSA